MKVEILGQWDLRRKAAKGFDPRTALISLGDWGSEPFTLPRQPEHTLRLLCNDITPALVNLSDPKDMFRLFSREQAGQVAGLSTTTWTAFSSASAATVPPAARR